MEALEIIAIVAVVALLLRFFGYLKAIPVKKQTAGILALVIAGAGIVVYDWGGIYSGLTAAVPGVAEPTVTPGVTFEAEGSETDTYLTYDAASKTFVCAFYENQTGGTQSGGASGTTGSSITSVTLTLTVYRTDLSTSDDNATAKVWAVVDTFYGKSENASILYAPVDKDDSTQKYEVAITPSGGSARDEYNYFSIATGGSKAISIVTDLYATGLTQLDNQQSKEVHFYITGVDDVFTLRFTKLGTSV